MPNPAATPTRPMTASHKEALAEGRRESAAVSRYLEVLETSRPKRGRKRTPESIDQQIARVDAALETAKPLQRLDLTQQRISLLDERDALNNTDALAEAEEAFVKYAGSYADRKGISYMAWRTIGVPADVLGRCGITR